MLWDITIIVLCVENVCYDFWNVYKSDHTKVLKFWNVIRYFQSVCVWLSRRTSHYPTQNYFPLIPFYSFLSYYSCTFQSVCNCVCFLLFTSISCTSWSSSLPILSLLYTTFFLPGIIYLLFLKLGLRCCNAPYTTQFWKLY